METINRRNLVNVDKDELAELQRRERSLRKALKALLEAWPADSLPPHAVAMQVAHAINNETP